MSLINGSVTALIDAFASPAPTPGGGSASALAGAVGASLLLMVARMPKTRTGTDTERETLARWAEPLDAARIRLTSLVDEDSAAYDAVVAAFRQPKATDEEKAARKAAIQAATLRATEVPLAVMDTCAAALSAAKDVASCGNPNASSDVRVGISLLAAGCDGAFENVAINLPGLADEQRRAALGARAAELRSAAREATAAVQSPVY
jgi:glutamate formiminotransferase/formiminotetrahydrofolate cyclodeaminase